MPEPLAVRVVRLDPDLDLPVYARAGDAGLDLVAREGATLEPGGGRAVIPAGIAVELAAGYAGLVLSRSGLAARHGVCCLNVPGLIDSGYRDELKVILVNLDPGVPYRVERGDRVAQLVVQRVEHVVWEEADRLAASARGAGGLGHTGR